MWRTWRVLTPVVGGIVLLWTLLAAAQSSTPGLLTDPTDCTTNARGGLYQPCVDLDDGKMWVCKTPAASGEPGACDSPAEWLAASGGGAGAAGGAGTLDTSTGNVTIANSTTGEATLYQFVVPGSTLGNNQCIQQNVLGTIGATGGSGTLTIRGKYGTGETSLAVSPSVASNQPFLVSLVVCGDATTSAQEIRLTVEQGVGSSPPEWRQASIAVDSTLGQIITITGQWNTSTSDRSVTKNYGHVLTTGVAIPPIVVTTFNSRSGTVVPASGDYVASQVTNTPAGTIAATTTQAAVNELDAEKQPLDADLTAFAATGTITGAQVTNTPTGAIGALTAQDAISELDAEKQPRDAELDTLANKTISSGTTVPTVTGAPTVGNCVKWGPGSTLDDQGAACGTGSGGGGTGLTDRDYGDWTISGGGLVATIDPDTITSAKIVNGAIVGVDIADSTITSAKINGQLDVAHGGTGLDSAPDDALIIGNGLLNQSKILPSCNPATQKDHYDATSNEWTCVTDATGTPSAFTLQQTNDASGASPEINVVANGLKLSSLTSATRSWQLCEVAGCGSGSKVMMYFNANHDFITEQSPVKDNVVNVATGKKHKVQINSVDTWEASAGLVKSFSGVTVDNSAASAVLLPAQGAPTPTVDGDIRYDNTNDVLKVGSNSTTKTIAYTTSDITGTAGGLSAGATIANYADFTEATAPATPAAGKQRIYAKTGSTMCSKNSAGTETCMGGAGSSGDVSSNTSTSVDSEIALFNSTTGKSIKRATTTGIAKVTAGVLSAATSTDIAAIYPANAVRRVCMLSIGDGTNTVQTGDIAPFKQNRCYIPYAATVLEIVVQADAGTPTVLVERRRDAATLADLLSGALTSAGTTEVCSNVTGTGTCTNGTTASASITLTNTSIAAGDWIEMKSGTGSTAKTIDVAVVLNVVLP